MCTMFVPIARETYTCASGTQGKPILSSYAHCELSLVINFSKAAENHSHRSRISATSFVYFCKVRPVLDHFAVQTDTQNAAYGARDAGYAAFETGEAGIVAGAEEIAVWKSVHKKGRIYVSSRT